MLLAFSLYSGQDRPSQLERVMQRGSLTMLTRNGASSYYLGPQGPTGPEYELVKAFAEFLGVAVDIEVTDTFQGLEHSLLAGRGDLIAANLTRTAARELRLNFGPDYLETSTEVIYRIGETRPAGVSDLLDMKIMVIAGSSYEDVLRQAAIDHPSLEWEVREDVGIEDLLLAVADGAIDATLIDSNIYKINQPFYPRISSAFSFGNKLPHAWAFPPGDDDTLAQLARAFILVAKTSGLVESIEKRFYQVNEQLGRVSMHNFLAQVRVRLPPLLDHFREAGGQLGIDWRLLAAIAYQESRWDPEAVSRTGVRGLMMLTKQTAKHMGIADRIDVEQSIEGGARYFLELYSRLPERIPDPDRIWLTLAAYNMGMGHLEDARVLTQRQGGDPDLWRDVEPRLDLLSQERYFRDLRYGYARGFEARKYVNNIKRYYNTLTWMDTRSHPLLSTQQL